MSKLAISKSSIAAPIAREFGVSRRSDDGSAS